MKCTVFNEGHAPRYASYGSLPTSKPVAPVKVRRAYRGGGGASARRPEWGADVRVVRQSEPAGGVPMCFDRDRSSSVNVRMREDLLGVNQWASPGESMSP